MKFGICSTSFVYPNGTGDIWADVKSHIQRAEQDGFDSFWVMARMMNRSSTRGQFSQDWRR